MHSIISLSSFPLSLHLTFIWLIPLPSGKVPFVHVGNQVVSELGPIVQFTKAKVSEPYE